MQEGGREGEREKVGGGQEGKTGGGAGVVEGGGVGVKRTGGGSRGVLPPASPPADCRPPYLVAATPRFDMGRISRCQNISAFKFISKSI